MQARAASVERYSIAGAFTISCGARTFVDVMTCAVTDGERVGRGTGSPIYCRAETARDCAAAITRVANDTAAFGALALVDDMLQPGTLWGGGTIIKDLPA